MTPLAIQQVLQFGAQEKFRDCQFFDLRALSPMILCAMRAHQVALGHMSEHNGGLGARPFHETKYAPADRCWFECELNGRPLWIYLEREERRYVTVAGGPDTSIYSGILGAIYDNGAIGQVLGDTEDDHLEQASVAFFAYAILDLLSQRDVTESRRLPSRFTSKQKRLIPHPPTVVFREIRLRPRRRSVSDGAVSEGPAKPLHFVLGHPRRLPGRTIYIPGHWKGCQSLGVVLHRYVSEGGEMKRLPDDGTLGKMTAREALAIVRPDVILPASLTGEPQ